LKLYYCLLQGILKRSSSHSNFPREGVAEHNNSEHLHQFRQPSDQFSERSTSKIPKLTLTWSEKNAVTIYGDTTSDEATTETDEAQVPAIAPFSTTRETHLLPPQPVIRLNVRRDKNDKNLDRQTAILHDDEEEEEEEGEEEYVMREEFEDSQSRNFDDGQHEPDVSNEPDTELSSDTTSLGTSHIAGKWWFGKSTKNIPHCAKWGCGHGRHDKECTSDNGEYLTPTQRRSREIQHLRKQLKLAVSQLEDKDSHLNELRDRLRDLESVIGCTNTFSEQRQIMQRFKGLVENYEREKQMIINKHEIRVRQLIQEAVDARAEMMKIKVALKQLQDSKAEMEMKEISTMTEPFEDTSDSVVHPEANLASSSFPSSPQQILLQKSLINHLIREKSSILGRTYFSNANDSTRAAYENEAMVWRTKSAQLEIILKEQILKTQGINPELEKFRCENERLRLYIKKLETNASDFTMVDSGIETHLNTLSSVASTECYSQQCAEHKRQLLEENNRLLEKVEEQTLQFHEYEEDANLLRSSIHLMENENKKSFLAMEQMAKEIEERTAEVKAANMAVVRLQSEVATKTKAICYLEERHQVYRNTILDHHLVIKDECTEDWHRGFSDPRYVVNVSKRVQTDLTEEALRNKEVNFISLKDKLKELEEEFSSKKSDMLDRFKEIEQDLLAKSALVDLLSSQLEEADREAGKSFELHQKEREAFQAKICELGKIAENVPVLKFEIEKLQRERGLLEYQLRSAKEEYDASLEMTLAESLKKYQKQSNYWAEKVSALNENNELLRKENVSLKRAMDELKVRTHVGEADLAERLASSIDHISYLKKQLNRSTRDVQVDVHPRVVSKYVACRPNARHKMTNIEKGDLYDEVEERLKLCQSELITTRQQVESLQQRLVTSFILFKLIP
uniref:GRIP domain-containing protein n=1 Tax=Thelazia callipaeda TaxID=103827 RepID=A0A0N5CNG9_THECL